VRMLRYYDDAGLVKPEKEQKMKTDIASMVL
jgi:DNA-binding transcriptional MerR regulator